jgi:purine-nucleoside/S-methyl-5'-thioadenosine phosphorylase / adenosine deaminase
MAPRHAQLEFELPGRGRALFTTRIDGNLSTGSGEDHAQGLDRRAQLCRRVELRWLCSSRQVHGTSVHVVERIAGAGGAPVAIDADGHAVAMPHVGATVLAADCLPVALGCDGAVAMLHAGWRGLAAGVLEEGVRVLRALGADDAPTAAVVGPGAGACCYEVGPEVHDAFAGAHAHGRRVDLRAIAEERLRAVGVAEVSHVDACTICDERFFSYRREGARAGRHAGIAWLS